MKKTWLWAGLAFLVLMSFAFSESLWTTLSRKATLRKMEKELGSLTNEVADAREKITKLENDPKQYDQLVRKELNYLRPGEKEVRIVDDQSN